MHPRKTANILPFVTHLETCSMISLMRFLPLDGTLLLFTEPFPGVCIKQMIL